MSTKDLTPRPEQNPPSHYDWQWGWWAMMVHTSDSEKSYSGMSLTGLAKDRAAAASVASWGNGAS